MKTTTLLVILALTSTTYAQHLDSARGLDARGLHENAETARAKEILAFQNENKRKSTILQTRTKSGTVLVNPGGYLNKGSFLVVHHIGKPEKVGSYWLEKNGKNFIKFTSAAYAYAKKVIPKGVKPVYLARLTQAGPNSPYILTLVAGKNFTK